MTTPTASRVDVDRGVSIDVQRLTRRAKDGTVVLDDVSLRVLPGELIAIVGGSGAGKTTLLEAMAGVRPADSGRVLLDGVDLYANLDTFRSVLGYVPQDDIIHTELPVEATLHYAARLRLPRDTSAAELDRTVESTMATLALIAKRDVRVGALSGGAAQAGEHRRRDADRSTAVLP